MKQIIQYAAAALAVLTFALPGCGLGPAISGNNPCPIGQSPNVLSGVCECNVEGDDGCDDDQPGTGGTGGTGGVDPGVAGPIEHFYKPCAEISWRIDGTVLPVDGHRIVASLGGPFAFSAVMSWLAVFPQGWSLDGEPSTVATSALAAPMDRAGATIIYILDSYSTGGYAYLVTYSGLWDAHYVGDDGSVRTADKFELPYSNNIWVHYVNTGASPLPVGWWRYEGAYVLGRGSLTDSGSAGPSTGNMDSTFTSWNGTNYGIVPHMGRCCTDGSCPWDGAGADGTGAAGEGGWGTGQTTGTTSGGWDGGGWTTTTGPSLDSSG